MGRIFAIKRYEIHDGDGIRTTVFMQGCPLRCKWCHNPEGLGVKPILGYLRDRCQNCGMCTSVCAAHTIKDGVHAFNRSMCTGLGKCAGVCASGALKLYGQDIAAKTLLPILLDDRDFYAASDGGVTLSGGEPMAQPDFTHELLSLLRSEGIRTALDTCGEAPWDKYARVAPLVDTFLFDVKAADAHVHRAITGASNERILQNLRELHDMGAKIEVRIPLIPGMNDAQMPKIGRILVELPGILGVRVLGYHNFSKDKYCALGIENAMGDAPLPDAQAVRQAEENFRDMGIRVLSF